MPKVTYRVVVAGYDHNIAGCAKNYLSSRSIA